ncbi:MAG: phospholipase D-like domain-containing protein [Bacillus subtilis]|nr:phospholipase D-like domain-containing protein [Bacillus subtilis]
MLGLVAVIVTVRIVLKQTYAYHKSHWIPIMLLSPVVGIILYSVFARDFRTGSLTRTRPLIAQNIPQAGGNDLLRLCAVSGGRNLPLHPRHHRPRGLRRRYRRGHPLQRRRLLPAPHRGARRTAKDYILMEFYIIKTDRIGRRVLDILASKAREGLDVRLLYDHFGSNRHLNAKYMRGLKEAGVKIAVFDPQQISFVDTNVNFRNHRKATIIDGKVGFLGGLNLGDEYNHDSKRFGFWRDTHVMLEGNGVTSIQNVFVKDWYYVTGAVLDKPLDKTVVTFPDCSRSSSPGPISKTG